MAWSMYLRGDIPRMRYEAAADSLVGGTGDRRGGSGIEAGSRGRRNGQSTWPWGRKFSNTSRVEKGRMLVVRKGQRRAAVEGSREEPGKDY